MKTINVKKEIKSSYANNRVKGDILKRKILNILDKGAMKITLDFEGVEVLSSSFIDEVFGKLPEEYKNPEYFELVNLILDEWKSEIMETLSSEKRIWQLSHFKVKGYKNLLDFEWNNIQNFNVVFGANASGKSALLEALKLIKSAHLGKMDKFFEEISQKYNTDPTTLISMGFREIEIVAEFRKDNIMTFRGTFSLKWNEVGKWVATGTGIYFSEDDEANEVYSFFQNEGEGIQYQGNYNDWMDFWENIKILKLNLSMLKSPSPSANKDLKETGENIPSFLLWLKKSDEKNFKKILYTLQTYVSEIEGIDLEIFELQGREWVRLMLKDSKGYHPASTVSDGTLRILAYITFLYANSTPSLLAIDEPENGFHPGRLSWWIENLVNRAQNKEIQIILTTHSPIIAQSVPRKFWWFIQNSPEGAEIQRFPEYVNKIEELV